MISEEEYLESIHELQNDGIIYKHNGKKYYRLKDEDTTRETDFNLTMESDSLHLVTKIIFPLKYF